MERDAMNLDLTLTSLLTSLKPIANFAGGGVVVEVPVSAVVKIGIPIVEHDVRSHDVQEPIHVEHRFYDGGAVENPKAEDHKKQQGRHPQMHLYPPFFPCFRIFGAGNGSTSVRSALREFSRVRFKSVN